MAVSAHERQIVDMGFLSLTEGGERFRVMALDKPVTTITVDYCKIEITSLARQLTVLP
jgi:hypothetical protein